jgi:predicted O-methyltransferase YrrM
VKNIFLLINYFVYRLKAKGAQGIHSPFVFELYNKVIREPHNYYEFAPIEHLKKRLLHSKDVINVTDFGAGGGGVYNRKVSDIAKKSAIPAKQGRFLFRLVNFVQPRNMIEIGTSLGISTLYQHKACPTAEMITMEGSPEVAAFAGTNFKLLKADSIKQVIGNFDDTLPNVIKKMPFVDYVFFDGNHRKQATLDYFRKFLPIASPTCVFVFDDIRWSPEMQEAWAEIIKEPKATVTIDLFSFGLVFFNSTQEKQHFILKY